MRPTLFHIPHQLGPLPIFGFGWALIAVLVFAGFSLLAAKTRERMMQVVQDQAIVWLILAGVVIFLLPRIESRIDDGTAMGFPIGLPVRGYGVLLMLGVVFALGIAAIRCEAQGISREAFYTLAVSTIVAGIVGARMFYVIQKWPTLAGDTFQAKLWTALQFTEGGLVVYGSVIGGLAAIAIWSYRNQVALLPLADAITPAFFIGLAFGRIGCLMNGCCFGGVCDLPLPAISFPAGAPAYMEQVESARLLGVQIEGQPDAKGSTRITSVQPGSWADKHGIHPGQSLDEVQLALANKSTADNYLAPPKYESMIRVDGKPYYIAAEEMPVRSLPVHPSQIYAAVSGLLLCAWTWQLSKFVRRRGAIFATGLIAYGILRNVEEYIRVDEAGQFGTSLSIAQWISFGAIAAGIAILVLSRKTLGNPGQPAPAA